MTRRKGAGSGRPPKSAMSRPGATNSAPPSRRVPSARWWLFAALALAAALVAWLAGGRHLPVGRRPPAPDPLAALDATEAYRRAIALQKDKHSYESLPLFRRALVGRTGDWRLRVNYAVALLDATMEARQAGPLAVPVTRNSLERVALMREALAQLDEAERLASGAEEKSFVIASRAHRLVVWGFPREASEEFHRAAALDLEWEPVARELDARLADPTRPDATEP